MTDRLQRTGRRIGPWLFTILAIPCIIALVVALLDILNLVPDQYLHVNRHTLATWTVVVGVTWSVLTVVAFVSLGTRAVRYMRVVGRRGVPSLLWRDILSKGGLAIPVSLIFLARLLIGSALGTESANTPDNLTNWLPWVIWTTLPPIIGMGAFVWWELFVIEADD